MKSDSIAFAKSLMYTSWLVDIPEKATVSFATYRIEETEIVMYFPATDYTNRMEYTVDNGGIVLYKNISSGADKGNTRVYTKRSVSQAPAGAGQNVPEGNQSAGNTEESSPANATSGMKNALEAAHNCLDYLPFSYTGLIEQLEFEGYTHAEATYAADNCGADWYEQAVRAAENYLEVMAFSGSGLIEQLEFEGYTHDQAVYDADKVY